MSPVTGLARLKGQLLPSVHMGNFNQVSELRFQPYYCSYGKFQLGYRDKQGATFQLFHPAVTGLDFSYEKISSPVTEISVTGLARLLL